MNITVEQLEQLYFESELELENGVLVKVVKEGEWEQDHKFQSLELIFTDGEKHYRGYIGRSGSYHSDWTYDSEVYGATDLAEVFEVEQRQITVTKWINVN